MAVFGPPGRGDRIARLLLLPLLFLFALLLTVFAIAFTPVRVIGDSMYPGLHDADRVLATRGYDVPAAGDVVSVHISGQPGLPEGDAIKRILALSGDTVRIDTGIAFINGVPEDSSRALLLSLDDVSMREMVVPDGHIFILGDNRPVSLDSRFFGPVPLDAVRGRVVFVFSPITRAGLVD